jgi:hypothetical protein
MILLLGCDKLLRLRPQGATAARRTKGTACRSKLAALEALWENVSQSPEAIESPEWHKEILDERRGSS